MQKFLLIIIVCTTATNIYSQTSLTSDNVIVTKRIADSLIEDTRLCWVTGGIGIHSLGASFITKLTYSWGNTNLSAKYAGASCFCLGSDGGNNNHLEEIGIFYGKQEFTRGILGRFAAGISYVPEARTYGKEVRGFGVGGESEIIFKASPIGIGLMLSTLVVPFRFWAIGVTLNIHLGKLEEWSQYIDAE